MKKDILLKNSKIIEEIFLIPSHTLIENRFAAESEHAGCDGVHCSSGGGCVGFLEQ